MQKQLICSLLHMTPKDVTSVIIANPIELGKAIDQKMFMLDNGLSTAELREFVQFKYVPRWNSKLYF